MGFSIWIGFLTVTFSCLQLGTLVEGAFGDEYRQSVTSYTAYVNITYKDSVTGEWHSEREESGNYGLASRLDSESGVVIHVRTHDNQTHGCTPPANAPIKERWIALIQRGECKFQQKIHNAAILKNASAVVIYDNLENPRLLTMQHQVNDVVSIFISKSKGQRIASLVDNGTKVMMHISVGRQQTNHYSSINKTSVLFVSISFIVLMIISLAWLVFYYIQRFRYAHAKERLSKRLMNAAKKAITKMPLRTIKNGDRETDSDFDQCAVCIESYRASDVIRILPCKHMFHKSCVDPWLIEQRSCPMCKMDILKAYGLQVHGSRDSVVNIEIEGPSTSIGPSELVPPEGSSRDMGANAVEVIRYQPAQVEYHDIPSSSESGVEGGSLSSSPPVAMATPPATALSKAEEEDEEDEDVLEGEEGERVGLVSGKDKTDGGEKGKECSGVVGDGKPCSLESVNTSSESDANELQSLMQHAASPPSSVSTSNPASVDQQQGKPGPAYLGAEELAGGSSS